MATQFYAKWTKVGQPDNTIMDCTTDSYAPDASNMIELNNLFDAEDIQTMYPDESHADLISWFYVNHKLHLKNNGMVAIIEGWQENGEPVLSQEIFYSGLVVQNGIVIDTESGITPEQRVLLDKQNEVNYINAQNGILLFYDIVSQSQIQFAVPLQGLTWNATMDNVSNIARIKKSSQNAVDNVKIATLPATQIINGLPSTVVYNIKIPLLLLDNIRKTLHEERALPNIQIKLKNNTIIKEETGEVALLPFLSLQVIDIDQVCTIYINDSSSSSESQHIDTIAYLETKRVNATNHFNLIEKL